jgi:hypothetical protein
VEITQKRGICGARRGRSLSLWHSPGLGMDWQPLQVELDCEQLVHTFEGNEANRSQMAEVLAEIKGASMLLPACKFTHIRRGANHVAHGLA